MKFQYASLSFGSGIMASVVPQAHQDLTALEKASEMLMHTPPMNPRSIQDDALKNISFDIQQGDKPSCQSFFDNVGYCRFAQKCFFHKKNSKQENWGTNICGNSCSHMKANFQNNACDSRSLQSYTVNGDDYLCSYKGTKGCVVVNEVPVVQPPAPPAQPAPPATSIWDHIGITWESEGCILGTTLKVENDSIWVTKECEISVVNWSKTYRGGSSDMRVQSLNMQRAEKKMDGMGWYGVKDDSKPWRTRKYTRPIDFKLEYEWSTSGTCVKDQTFGLMVTGPNHEYKIWVTDNCWADFAWNIEEPYWYGCGNYNPSVVWHDCGIPTKGQDNDNVHDETFVV